MNPNWDFWFKNVLSCNPLNLNKLNDIDEKICIGSYTCITKQVTNKVSVLIPFIKIKLIQEPVLQLLNLGTF
jgi:hypothetical protein